LPHGVHDGSRAAPPDAFCTADLRAPGGQAASEKRRMDVRQLEYFRIPSITCR